MGLGKKISNIFRRKKKKSQDESSKSSSDESSKTDKKKKREKKIKGKKRPKISDKSKSRSSKHGKKAIKREDKLKKEGSDAGINKLEIKKSESKTKSDDHTPRKQTVKSPAPSKMPSKYAVPSVQREWKKATVEIEQKLPGSPTGRNSKIEKEIDKHLQTLGYMKPLLDDLRENPSFMENVERREALEWLLAESNKRQTDVTLACRKVRIVCAGLRVDKPLGEKMLKDLVRWKLLTKEDETYINEKVWKDGPASVKFHTLAQLINDKLVHIKGKPGIFGQK